MRRDPWNHVKVLDIHDGELIVTIENRRLICRLIPDWQADIVISHPARRLLVDE